MNNRATKLTLLIIAGVFLSQNTYSMSSLKAGVALAKTYPGRTLAATAAAAVLGYFIAPVLQYKKALADARVQYNHAKEGLCSFLENPSNQEQISKKERVTGENSPELTKIKERFVIKYASLLERAHVLKNEQQLPIADEQTFEELNKIYMIGCRGKKEAGRITTAVAPVLTMQEDINIDIFLRLYQVFRLSGWLH